jgi:hypothetical protein
MLYRQHLNVLLALNKLGSKFTRSNIPMNRLSSLAGIDLLALGHFTLHDYISWMILAKASPAGIRGFALSRAFNACCL